MPPTTAAVSASAPAKTAAAAPVSSAVIPETVPAFLTHTEQQMTPKPPAFNKSSRESAAQQAHDTVLKPLPQSSVNPTKGTAVSGAVPHDADAAVIDRMLSGVVRAVDADEEVQPVEKPTASDKAGTHSNYIAKRVSSGAQAGKALEQTSAKKPFRLSADVDDALADLSAAAVTDAAQGVASAAGVGQQGSPQAGRLTADVDGAVADSADSAVNSLQRGLGSEAEHTGDCFKARTENP